MMFVGQFPVPGEAERMAYVFITDDRDGGYPTWGAEDGENAVIIQPYGRVPSFIETIEAATGPTLWKRGPAWGDGPPVELHIDLAPLDAETEQALEADADSCEAWRSGAMPEYPNHGVVTPRDYVGGRPVFWQRHHPIPVPEDWRFFLQFDDFDGYDLPALNFAGGTGYIFLSHDGLEGRFYWDCI